MVACKVQDAGAQSQKGMRPCQQIQRQVRLAEQHEKRTVWVAAFVSGDSPISPAYLEARDNGCGGGLKQRSVSAEGYFAAGEP